MESSIIFWKGEILFSKLCKLNLPYHPLICNMTTVLTQLTFKSPIGQHTGLHLLYFFCNLIYYLIRILPSSVAGFFFFGGGDQCEEMLKYAT